MPNEILTRAIDSVASGTHLTADHASAVLTEIMEGRAGEVQTGAFLVALRTKGETVQELVGLARTMRGLSTPVECTREDLVDTAGTGGGPSTFNVSTTAALVAAGAGCAVAKHLLARLHACLPGKPLPTCHPSDRSANNQTAFGTTSPATKKPIR